MKVKELINETAKTVVEELKKDLINTQELSVHKKTEQLLYHYTSFKQNIKLKEEKIFEIQLQGVPKRSRGITSFMRGVGGEIISEYEKREEQIEVIRKSIERISVAVNLVDGALKLIEDDKYYDIIPLKYFEGKTLEEISKDLNKDPMTIFRNKSRLLGILKVAIFSDELANEILG